MQEICRQTNKRSNRGKERTRKERKRQERKGKKIVVLIKNNEKQLLTCSKRLRLPTYIEDVQGGDVRGGRAQLIGCLHPDLIRSEEGEVAGDVAGVTLLPRAVIFTLLLSPVPPGQKHNKHNDHSNVWRFVPEKADWLFLTRL